MITKELNGKDVNSPPPTGMYSMSEIVNQQLPLAHEYFKYIALPPVWRPKVIIVDHHPNLSANILFFPLPPGPTTGADMWKNILGCKIRCGGTNVPTLYQAIRERFPNGIEVYETCSCKTLRPDKLLPIIIN